MFRYLLMFILLCLLLSACDKPASPQEVTITCALENAKFNYTLDGIGPTETSSPYTGPILIAANTTLKAKGFKPDWLAEEPSLNGAGTDGTRSTIRSAHRLIPPVLELALGEACVEEIGINRQIDAATLFVL